MESWNCITVKHHTRVARYLMTCHVIDRDRAEVTMLARTKKRGRSHLKDALLASPEGFDGPGVH